MQPVFRSSSRWKFVVGVGIVFVIVFWEFVWRVFKEVFTTFVPIMTTPVILELSLFFIGLSAVIIWNHHRGKKEEADEWVYLSQVEPEVEGEEVPDSLKKRAGESLFREAADGKPEGLNVAIGKVEGFLELGMLDEAGEELMQLTDGVHLEEQPAEVLKLRIELCRQQKGETAAEDLAAEWRSRGLLG